MEKILAGTLREGAEAVTGALSSNKKITDMKYETVQADKDSFLTSDYGVKQSTHDEWLSATTGDRQGPQLLEDNFSREKVC